MRLPLRCRIPEARFEAGFARVRAELDVPDRFPTAVLDEAAAAAAAGPAVPAGADAEVRDATDLMLVAIDPAGSTDLDQAYGARRRGSGYRVHYAIADVASLVAPEGAIDTEARRRGVTLYSPDLRTSLHPEAISEQAGSLLAGEIRQALLWTIDLDSDAEPVAAHMQRATVRNRQQLSYRAAQQQIPTVDPDHPLALLREIGELRLQREIDRDAV
ncbi:MAG: RNB domain-containing ribonuclease, partial [Acidimicrobiales bacterium]